MKQATRAAGRTHHSGPTDEDQHALAPSEETQNIDLNHATEEELCAIEGVDKQLAHAIVEYRIHAGHFLSWDDLSGVPGVSSETVNQIRHSARIGGA